MFFQYDPIDGSCNPEEAVAGTTANQNNVTIQIGASKFL